jgi:predicted metal-dependent phosphoesterase TrpH
MYDIDLHTHSRFFHSFEGEPTAFDRFGFRLNISVARARDLDGIAITNHDYFTTFDIDTGGLDIIPGVEISTDEGHLLVVGPDPPDRTPPGKLSPEKAVEIAHSRNCAAIMAHPFRSGTVKDAAISVDAVEVNGKHPQTAPLVEELARDRGLPIVGGSDAHYPFEIGRVITRLSAEELTAESVVDAIEAGEIDFQTVQRFPDQYTQLLYSAVHKFKEKTRSKTPKSG